MNCLNDVAEFHKRYDCPILETPQIPPPDRASLRISLLAEELDEFRTAVAQGDLVAVADALCDLQYVLSGAVLEFGLQGKFEALFAEVQRSNMAKSCTSKSEVLQSIKAYQRQGVDAYDREVAPGLWNIYRASDDKVLKSITWTEPELASIIYN